jgi:hypothetical protein
VSLIPVEKDIAPDCYFRKLAPAPVPDPDSDSDDGGNAGEGDGDDSN